MLLAPFSLLATQLASSMYVPYNFNFFPPYTPRLITWAGAVKNGFRQGLPPIIVLAELARPASLLEEMQSAR